MQLTRRRFTTDEYHRMAEVGLLTEDDRVELITVVDVQNPLRLGEHSEPVPAMSCW